MEEQVEKNLEIERKERYKDNLGRELEMFSAQLPEVEKRLQIHQDTVKLLKRNQEIAISNFTFNDPKWGYESIPEYIENIRQLNILNFEKAQLDWNNQELQLINHTKSIKSQIETASKEIEKVTAELAVLKGE